MSLRVVVSVEETEGLLLKVVYEE
jgi:hypothetical protein